MTDESCRPLTPDLQGSYKDDDRHDQKRDHSALRASRETAGNRPQQPTDVEIRENKERSGISVFTHPVARQQQVRKRRNCQESSKQAVNRVKEPTQPTPYCGGTDETKEPPAQPPS